jgi:hypothetical protein
MIQPFVGPPTEGRGCAFSADIDCPACGQPSTAHLLLNSDWGLVSLASCPIHVAIARAAGQLLGEHDYAPTCTMRDCWFNWNDDGEPT